MLVFRSVKSKALRDMQLARKEQLMKEKVEEKQKMLLKMRQDNPEIEIDERKFLGIFHIIHT